MRSLAEILAEKVGYALAAVVLGPPAAMARRERRVLRAAFDDWCEELEFTRLESTTRGTMRRSLHLRLPMEVELATFERRATLDVAIGKLPPHARATLAKRPRRGPRRIMAVHVDSATLDAKTTQALAEEIAASPIGVCDTFELTIDSERVLFEVAAPREGAEWKALAEALVTFAESCTRRWSVSYR